MFKVLKNTFKHIALKSRKYNKYVYSLGVLTLYLTVAYFLNMSMHLNKSCRQKT